MTILVFLHSTIAIENCTFFILVTGGKTRRLESNLGNRNSSLEETGRIFFTKIFGISTLTSKTGAILQVAILVFLENGRYRVETVR